jgi:puromycin-sensitive aminopeptidase
VLVKPNVTSENTKRGIARTICHELAHQWFGNLVTMEWWTQLYLNEGMARFMEFVAIDQLFPDWSAWTEFVQSVYGTAMALDAMKTSHPVEVEVHHPAEIDSIFDAISYAKGASIIRMIASYIGMDIFFQGMRTYLTRHAYGNTVTNDLWIALEEVSNKPIVEFMAPWTQYMGYPILEISNDRNIKLDRFLADGPECNENCNTTNPPLVPWYVPVTVKVEGIDEIQGPWIINGTSCGGVVDQSEQLQTKIKEWSALGKWFKLNVDQTAFFRVKYNPQQWQRLAYVMGPDSSLSTTDRLGLISDCFAAGKAGYSPITDAFMLVEKFGEHETAGTLTIASTLLLNVVNLCSHKVSTFPFFLDTDYAVWQELSDNLSSLASLYRSERFYGKFQSFLSRLYTRQMDKLGWEPKPNERGRVGTLRATVISMMGKSGNERIAQKSFELFKACHDDPDGASLSGDLRESIYRCAMRYDEEFVFNTLKDIYENSSFPEEQRDCLAIMGCVRDPSRHAAMLEYVFNSGMVRLQDISIPLSSLASVSDEGGRATWEYFQRNVDKLQNELNSGPLWPVCVGICCLGITTLSGADEVENFFDNHLRPVGSASKRLSQALEVIRTKAHRRDRDRNTVDVYFS